MKYFSTMFIFSRGLLTLATIPFLTGLISLTTMILALLLGYRGDKLQFLPRWWGRTICRISGVKVLICGAERLDRSKPYIFAANHQSQFDIFVLQGYLGFNFRWLAKKELFAIPLFGWAMRRAGYIAVDRGHGRRALTSLNEAAQEIAGGASVIIFPEGTRSPDGRLQPIKPGAMALAIKAGVELVPLAIIGTHEVLAKGKLLARPGQVIVRIDKPIATADFSLQQKQQLADLLAAKLKAMLQTAPSDSDCPAQSPLKAHSNSAQKLD